MDKHKEFAKRWFVHSKSLNGYMEFICHYICLEILTKGNSKNFDTLVKSINSSLQISILNNCRSQVEYFQNTVVYNEYSRGERNTEKYADILKNSNETHENKLIALLKICKIIRGNIVHGHKSFEEQRDINIANSGIIFFRSFFHFIFS